METLTIVSTMFWLLLVGSLSVVSIFFSNGKSNRCFNNLLSLIALHNLTVVSTIFLPCIFSSLSIVLTLCQMENLSFVSTIFWHFLVGNLFDVSILFSSGKSNRCYNNVLAFHCRHFICRFNSFFKWKISPLFQQFVIFDCRKSIRCFNSFLKWIIKLFFQQLFCLAL